jgi:Domain of unknown function (DUF5666)
MRKANHILTLVALAALCATACGESNGSPTSPASSSPATAAPGPSSSSGSATITGTLGGVSTSSAGMRPQAITLTVTVSGTNISASVSPGSTFVLSGVPAGNVELHFMGSGVDARNTIADVADNEQIHIVVNVHGTNADIEINDREGPNHEVELEGLIVSINVGARTMVVDGKTVSVPASAVIRHGDTSFTLAQLKVGQRVHVKGTTSGSTIVASEVMLQDENPEPPGHS